MFFPPSVTPLSLVLWSRAVMYPEWGTIAQMYHNQDTFNFCQGHVTIKQYYNTTYSGDYIGVNT